MNVLLKDPTAVGSGFKGSISAAFISAILKKLIKVSKKLARTKIVKVLNNKL
jgi:hypothetical protein